MDSKAKIVDEIRSLQLKEMPSGSMLNDSEHLRARRGLVLLDELINKLCWDWSLRDLPDALAQKASILRLLGRYNESHECLLEAYSLEFCNSEVYFAMMALYRQIGALACVDQWQCMFFDRLYANQKGSKL